MAKSENWGLDAKRLGGIIRCTVEMQEPGALSSFHRALAHKLEVDDEITVRTKRRGIYPARRLLLKVMEVELL